MTARVDDYSLRAAAKNTPSGGPACMETLHSAARPWPALILRGQTAEKQQHYVVMLFVRMSEMEIINITYSTGSKMSLVNYWSKRWSVGTELFDPASYKLPYIILACIS